MKQLCNFTVGCEENRVQIMKIVASEVQYQYWYCAVPAGQTLQGKFSYFDAVTSWFGAGRLIATKITKINALFWGSSSLKGCLSFPKMTHTVEVHTAYWYCTVFT